MVPPGSETCISLSTIRCCRVLALVCLGLVRFEGVLGHLALSWRHLGSILGRLGAILGFAWAVLEPSWGHLGVTVATSLKCNKSKTNSPKGNVFLLPTFPVALGRSVLDGSHGVSWLRDLC